VALAVAAAPLVLLAVALLDGALLALVAEALFVLLGADDPPELHAASSAAAVTAIPGVSQYLRLSVIAMYLRLITSLG
jgi:hypothetical protein